MPLADLCALIGPGNCRGPSALKHRFRIHLLHRWFSQFETACEQAECDSPALCSLGIDLRCQQIPDTSSF